MAWLRLKGLMAARAYRLVDVTFELRNRRIGLAARTACLKLKDAGILCRTSTQLFVHFTVVRFPLLIFQPALQPVHVIEATLSRLRYAIQLQQGVIFDTETTVVAPLATP